MKRLVWNYEKALKARDAAVTWLLICKTRVIVHKDVDAKIAHHIYNRNDYEYADGDLIFSERHQDLFSIISFSKGRVTMYNGLHMFKSYQFKQERFLEFLSLILKLCNVGMKWSGKRWTFYEEDLCLDKLQDLLLFFRQFSCKNYLLLKNEKSKQESWCKTIGDAIDFFKRVPKTDEIVYIEYIVLNPKDKAVYIKHNIDFG